MWTRSVTGELQVSYLRLLQVQTFFCFVINVMHAYYTHVSIVRKIKISENSSTVIYLLAKLNRQ